MNFAVVERAAWAAVYPRALELARLAARHLGELDKAAAATGAAFYDPYEDRVCPDYRPGRLWRVKAAVAPPPAPTPVTPPAAPPPPPAPKGMTWPDVLGPLAGAAGWRPGPTASLLGGPSTLSAAVGSGLLGAGLGYGAGWALENTLLADRGFKRGRLRRVLAGLGGGLGVAPALWAGARGWFKESAYGVKQASDGFTPTIHRDGFNRMVVADPYTPPALQAATVGLVRGASDLRGGSPWVSPADVGRLAAGMGTGYLSGMLVGRALGALAGMPADAQRELQRAGTWAGFLAGVVPIAYGGSGGPGGMPAL